MLPDHFVNPFIQLKPSLSSNFNSLSHFQQRYSKVWFNLSSLLHLIGKKPLLPSSSSPSSSSFDPLSLSQNNNKNKNNQNNNNNKSNNNNNNGNINDNNKSNGNNIINNNNGNNNDNNANNANMSNFDKNEMNKPLTSSQLDLILDPLSEHSLFDSNHQYSPSFDHFTHSSSSSNQNEIGSKKNNKNKNKNENENENEEEENFSQQKKKEEKEYFEKCISLGNYSGMDSSVCVSVCFKLLECMQLMGSLQNFFFFSQLLEKLEKILLLNHNLLQNSISVASEKYVFHFQLLMHASIISDNFNFSKQSLNFLNLVSFLFYFYFYYFYIFIYF